MLSQIASVFSSQGVVLQDTERVGFPVPNQDALVCDHKGGCKCFGPVFDQAAAKLELSGRAVKAAEEAANQDPARGELTPEERKAVEKLKERDREVRRHEMAHLAGSGGHARGGARYEYETGPDGRSYAVGGHVDIDMSPVRGNPQATLQKAMAVQRAALAPAEPSGADQAVAAAAAGMAREAVRELAERKSGAGKTGSADPASEARRNPYAPARPETGRIVDAFA